jgi:YebC/PmpR family DNA-binding regulatory protein
MGRGPSIAGRKSAEDARRGKVFTKLIREITAAARIGGGDPAGNARLRMAIDKAVDQNMPKDTIERALKRGSGEAGGDAFEQIRYEGYAPGGVALMVDCLTDNPTRTVADVRHAFAKQGGHLGTTGSVGYLFNRVGEIAVELQGKAGGEEQVMEIALDAGADDVVGQGDWVEVLTSAERFEPVKKALQAAGFTPFRADIVMRAATSVVVSGADAEAVSALVARLEDLDDVQHVYTNAQLPA